MKVKHNHQNRMKRKKNIEKSSLKSMQLAKHLFSNTKVVEANDDDLQTDQRVPAWHDEDDDKYLAKDVMDTKSKEVYTKTLRNKYETLIGTPGWAKLNRDVAIDSDGEEHIDILQSVGHIAKQEHTSLRKGVLEIKRLPKINAETHNEGPIITALEFHPSTSVALVGGQSGIVSLFSIGTEQNTKLHSIALEKFSILNACFLPGGNEAVISSDRSKYYFSYDLNKAEAVKVFYPPGLKKPTSFEVSPCGKFIAVTDGFNEIHIICSQSKEKLKCLRLNMKVQAIAFTTDSKMLYCFGNEGTIAVYDLSMFRVTHKFADEGCITGSCLSLSSCGKYLATGSGEGIVNIYDVANTYTPNPAPVHTVKNLTTKISRVKFNSSSEILGISSSYLPKAMKLVHVPSFQVFKNFPEQQSNYDQITTFNFSPNSGFLSIANKRNSAYLLRLKHYQNY